MIKNILKRTLRNAGYEIRKRDFHLSKNGIPYDIKEQAFLDIYERVKDYTLCSIEPMYALYKSIEYIVKNDIPGDLVECGVFKGGSTMMMAYSLMHFKCKKARKIYLYDTFEGMSEPDENDIDLNGNKAEKLLNMAPRESNQVWAYCPLDRVMENVYSTGFENDKFVFTKGKVEDTIPLTLPSKIGLLRLDTDWYSSTIHELNHLYPLLVKQGVLIIDDYGHWHGARKATDEYFQNTKINILLHRIDYTVRVGIKNL